MVIQYRSHNKLWVIVDVIAALTTSNLCSVSCFESRPEHCRDWRFSWCTLNARILPRLSNIYILHKLYYYYYYYYYKWHLWSSGQSSWLHIQRFGFDSRRYQIFWEAVGVVGLVSTIEELLEVKSRGSSLENQDYGVEIRCADYSTPLYTQKLALTSPTSRGR
jgi:hypothetical protein